jgi:hypothetical protein
MLAKTASSGWGDRIAAVGQRATEVMPVFRAYAYDDSSGRGGSRCDSLSDEHARA